MHCESLNPNPFSSSMTFSSAQLVWAFALLVVLLFRPSIACQYIITPAYFYPSGSLLQYWNASEEAAPTNKILVANVDSGPGASLDTDYQSALDGATPYLTVIGYVHSAYGAAPISDVIANMSLWKSLYGIQSFFLDETDSTSASLEYYQNLTTEIRQKYHNALLVANLGTMPAVEVVSFFHLAPQAMFPCLIYCVFSRTPMPTTSLHFLQVLLGIPAIQPRSSTILSLQQTKPQTLKPRSP